ncbi:MAG: HD domain-containing protein [Puniceicoccales bacterium]|nr:HD domain-containing protein [Puniceicoccales bacterium]
MDKNTIQNCIEFLQKAESLKNTVRSAYTSAGRRESSAEHTWRLCLMILTFEKELAGLDMAKLLKMAVIHDLAEAVCGDISAVDQKPGSNKAEMEKNGMISLLSGLPQDIRDSLFSLWQEYEDKKSPEAAVVKGLDKLETLIQHNQGQAPAGFIDFSFNITYGETHMDSHPLLRKIRDLVDVDTRRNANNS